MLISRSVSFIMLPIYTRYLTPADYGVMALVEMTLDFISIIGGAQLALGVFRFYHREDSADARQQVVSTSFVIVGALYIVVGLAVFLLAHPLSNLLFDGPAQTGIIRIAALNLAANCLLIVPLAFARVRDLSMLYVSANVGKLVLAVALNIVFVVILQRGVTGIFLSALISNAAVGLVVSVWLVREIGVRPSREWTRNLVRYGLPLMGMQVATFLTTFSDRYFLQAASDEARVGLYSLAYQFGFLLYAVAFTPMDMVWGPKRFEIATNHDGKELLSKGFLVHNVLLWTTAMGISLYVGDVLRVMATPAFLPAAQVVPLILLAYIFQGWASIQDIGILVAERTEFLAIANVVAAVVAVSGYAILVPLYLQWGAAAATVLAFGTRYLLTYRFSQHLWPVRYGWRPIVVLILWATCISAIGLYLPTMPLLPSLSVRTGLVLVFGAGLWLLPILGPTDRHAVALAARSVARKLSRSRRRTIPSD
jgi:O-antigen/teichoic acid export membrane protein